MTDRLHTYKPATGDSCRVSRSRSLFGVSANRITIELSANED